MTHHFFLPRSAIQGTVVMFPSDSAHQIQKVLRMRSGDEIVVLDNTGTQYIVRLEYGEKLTGLVVRQSTAQGEPRRRIWLYLSLSQREKFEWVLQKGTELGCTGFVPMVTQRSLVQDGKNAEKKRERWETILKEAAEQCHRGRIPELAPTCSYDRAVDDAIHRCDAAYIPWVSDEPAGFRARLKTFDQEALAIMIGPEGGFTDGEIETALKNDIIPVSLGPRVLRMETAAIAAITIAMAELGELDQPYSVSGGGPAGP